MKQNLNGIEKGKRKPMQEKSSWFNMTIQVTLRNNFHLPRKQQGLPFLLQQHTHTGFIGVDKEKEHNDEEKQFGGIKV